MRDEYDFETMNGKKNPYSKRVKQAVSLRIDQSVIKYFKNLSEETGIPYQTLINFYLLDCAESKKKLKIEWAG